MCLGVPGQVTEVHESPVGMTMGKVSFSGISKEVCLAYLDDVEPGEWVVVHVGFAISRIDEEEARQVFEFLASMDELDEIEVPELDAPGGAGVGDRPAGAGPSGPGAGAPPARRSGP